MAQNMNKQLKAICQDIYETEGLAAVRALAKQIPAWCKAAAEMEKRGAKEESMYPAPASQRQSPAKYSKTWTKFFDKTVKKSEKDAKKFASQLKALVKLKKKSVAAAVKEAEKLAKATEKALKKQVANETKAAEKAQKLALKEAEKAQKLALKEAEKAQKKAEKEAEKAQKKAEKEAEKALKKAENEAQKLAEKEVKKWKTARAERRQAALSDEERAQIERMCEQAKCQELEDAAKVEAIIQRGMKEHAELMTAKKAARRGKQVEGSH